MIYRRLITYSRKEPARTILVIVAAMTLVAQLLTLALYFPGVWWAAVPNTALISGLAGWGLWAGIVNRVRQMSWSSFGLFLVWLFTGVLRLMSSPDPTQLLWFPFLVVAAVMGVVYLYLTYHRRIGDLG